MDLGQRLVRARDSALDCVESAVTLRAVAKFQWPETGGFAIYGNTLLMLAGKLGSDGRAAHDAFDEDVLDAIEAISDGSAIVNGVERSTGHRAAIQWAESHCQFLLVNGTVKKSRKHWEAARRQICDHPDDAQRLITRVRLEHVEAMRRLVAERHAKTPSYLGDGKVQVGEMVRTLTTTEGDVLGALVRLRSATLTELGRESGTDKNAPVYLKSICSKHPELQPHIILPGRKGRGGYRTSITDGQP